MPFALYLGQEVRVLLILFFNNYYPVDLFI